MEEERFLGAIEACRDPRITKEESGGGGPV